MLDTSMEAQCRHVSKWSNAHFFGCIGGYSGDPIDSVDECLQVEGFAEVLCMAWRTDNAGPHDVDEVRAPLGLLHYRLTRLQQVR
jgi:hypothetical protein